MESRLGRNEKKEPTEYFSDGKFNNFSGPLTTNNTEAWVGYQTYTKGDKGAAEDAYFMDQIPKELSEQLKALSQTEQEKIVTKTIEETLDQMQDMTKSFFTRETYTGTTLSAAFVFNNRAYIINVGDSMAHKYDGKKLGEKPILEAHDATNLKEVERVKNPKGDKPEGYFVGKRLCGILMVTRSIGGTHNIFGITHKAEIKIEPFVGKEQILLASDGLTKELDVIDGKTKIKTGKILPGLQILAGMLKKTKDLKNTADSFLSDYKNGLNKADDISMMVIDANKEGLYGICDGHGGKQASYTISQEFGPTFTKFLKNNIEQRLQAKHKEQISLEKKEVNSTEKTVHVEETAVSSPSSITILMKEGEKSNAGEIFKNASNYISAMIGAYSQLHPLQKNKSSELITFIKETLDIKGNNVQKMESLFARLNSELQKIMKAQGQDNLDDLAVHLNRNLSKHHSTRLLLILYQQLQNSFSLSDDNKVKVTIRDGVPSMPVKMINSFFNKTFDKKSKDDNPYVKIRNELLVHQVRTDPSIKNSV